MAEKYISMSAVRDALSALVNKGRKDLHGGIMAAYREIVMIPAADVAPVRHGRWEQIRPEPEKTGNYLYECSNCHMSDIHFPTVSVPYCWHCGAKMVGGDTP